MTRPEGGTLMRGMVCSCCAFQAFGAGSDAQKGRVDVGQVGAAGVGELYLAGPAIYFLDTELVFPAHGSAG